MSWAKQHPVDTVADYVAPALLAAASGWAARSALLPPLFMITVAILAFAAGALLTMIIDTMAPEAVEQSGAEAGLATILGFALAATLSGMA